MIRRAVLAFPDDTGEPQARLVLERLQWEAEHLHAYCVGGPPLTAAWLMCNPSRASHEIDDPTAGRVVTHSRRFGCPRSLVGNVWPLRTPYPADLWAMLARGDLSPAMRLANLESLAMIGGQADLHIAAFGAEPGRRHKAAVMDALDAFTLGGRFPLYSLGTTDDGMPLHPLARGKFAIPRDAPLRPWERGDLMVLAGQAAAM